MRDNFSFSEIPMRTSCFIAEARKRGLKFKAARGPFGYTNHFWAEINGKRFRFEGLPTAQHINKYDLSIIDSKEKVKILLKKGNFPIAKGKSFWFWQKEKALKFGSEELGFPLVVKPRSGSFAHHVTTNIRSKEELKKAIDKAVIYSPAFLVERYIETPFVYRATVVDFDFVAVVKQIPANIVGDGISTIGQLVERKNSDEKRGQPDQKGFSLYKILVDETTMKLLKERNYNLKKIPKKGEIVYLQKDPFLKLGGDLVEVTKKVHPANLQLFKDIAKFFDLRLVGIDFSASDISKSWQDQPCAILELNSLPCIEMHHFPTFGPPQNVARAIVNLFFKYYL